MAALANQEFEGDPDLSHHLLCSLRDIPRCGRLLVDLFAESCGRSLNYILEGFSISIRSGLPIPRSLLWQLL